MAKLKTEINNLINSEMMIISEKELRINEDIEFYRKERDRFKREGNKNYCLLDELIDLKLKKLDELKNKRDELDYKRMSVNQECVRLGIQNVDIEMVGENPLNLSRTSLEDEIKETDRFLKERGIIY